MFHDTLMSHPLMLSGAPDALVLGPAPLPPQPAKGKAQWVPGEALVRGEVAQ